MKAVGVRLQKPFKNGDLIAGALVGKAQEDNSSVRAPLSIDFLAKVLVVSNENPVLIGRLRNDVIVVHSTRFVVDREDLVLLSAQPMGYHWSSAFIDKKPQLYRLQSKRHKCRILERFGREQQTRLNIMPS